MGKTNALRNKISSFQQQPDESIPKAWEWMQEYVVACPPHGMEDWLLIRNFYHGLVPLDRSHLDATTGGAFFLLNVIDAKALIEKMVPIKDGAMNVYSPAKEVCILLKKLVCL